MVTMPRENVRRRFRVLYRLFLARIIDLEFLVRAGVLRLIDNGASPFRGRLSEHDAGLIHSLQLQPKAVNAQNREGLGGDRTRVQVQAVHSLGNIPLVILTAAGGIPSADEAMAVFMRWKIYTTQTRLASLSTRGRHIILEHSGHMIPFDAPGAVIDAVRSLLYRW
jgi:pimeloyl-ACP methyl ester carboxylesterase